MIAFASQRSIQFPDARGVEDGLIYEQPKGLPSLWSLVQVKPFSQTLEDPMHQARFFRALDGRQIDRIEQMRAVATICFNGSRPAQRLQGGFDAPDML